MNKSKMLSCIFLVCLQVMGFICFASSSSYAMTDEFSFIAEDADIILSIKNDGNDEGLSFVTNLWRDRFDLKESSAKNEAVNKLYSEVPSATIIGAAYLPQEAFDKKDKPIYPDFVIIVKVEESDKVVAEAIETLIKKRKPLKRTKYEGFEIVYRDKKLEPFHGQKDLAAYAKIDKYFIIAMTPDKLYKSIDCYKGSKRFDKRKLEPFLKNLKSDAYIYINNESGLFSKNLKRWEEKEGMRVMLSSKSLSSIFFSLNIATNDAINGEVIFKPKRKADVVAIEDDSYFFQEMIRRSFVKQDIDWISEIVAEDGNIILSFEGTGFENIWEEALLSKRIAFLEKEEEEVIEDDSDIDTSSSKTVKIIFMVIVVGIVIGVITFIRKKK